jgi:CDP-glucose 4,6-dehydratase
MSASFFRDRRVLVTGHTGFKGGWLATWLKLLGARVHGFALPPEGAPSLFDAARVGEGMVSRLGDVRDAAAVEAAVEEADPEVVFHLAAQPLVRRSYDDPVGTYAANVMGTVHLLDALRRAPRVRSVVVVTTDKCYENREWEWGYREDDALGGRDPYSSSKACTELVAAAYRDSFLARRAGAPVGVATARAGNVIGGGDWAEDRVVPDTVRALSLGEPVVLRNPGAVRPWQHVLEPLRGYLVLAERLWADPERFARAWNFGPRDDDAVPVGALVERMVAAWGGGSYLARPAADGKHEAGLLRLDCSRARAGLAWTPLLTLDATARMTVDWYRAHAADPSSAADTTARQIRAYAAGLAPRIRVEEVAVV